jgi:uncharacterized protein (DUF362 family)
MQNPKDSTRREFIKGAAVAGGALALAPGLAWPQEPAAESYAMSIARWEGDTGEDADLAVEAKRLTEAAILALGGMERFVSKGDVVWIKPNLAWNRPPKLAATTNPDVVAELVRLCFEAGAKTVKIGDHTCHPAKQAYRSSGAKKVAEATGAELVYLDEKRFKEVKLGGERLETWPLYTEMLDADLLINVPIAKHHGLSEATLAMKNYMGVIGGRRSTWHQALPACLRDITAYMKPRLCVLDAVRVLMEHGPQGGRPSDVERRDTVAASTDIVALDAFGAELLGHAPGDLDMLRVAVEAGLGEPDYRKLPLQELVVS